MCIYIIYEQTLVTFYPHHQNSYMLYTCTTLLSILKFIERNMTKFIYLNSV